MQEAERKTGRAGAGESRPARLAARAVICTLIAMAAGVSAQAGDVSVADYGVTKDGRQVRAFTLSNGHGASAIILDYGATVAAINVPDRKGEFGNVVMSFSDLSAWETLGHANAVIGRYANRLKGGFTLDGVHYPLTQNAAGVTLHGGPPTYSTRVWSASVVQGEAASVSFELDSPAGDQGFPGALRVTATYTLTDANELRLDFTAATDAPTVLNLTNHIYFNLSGDSAVPVYDHQLTMSADRIAHKDETNTPDGLLVATQDTPLDLNQPKSLRSLAQAALDPRFAAPRVNAPTLAEGQLPTFDHAYVLDTFPRDPQAVAARLTEAGSGRVLEVRTSEPSIQVFVSNSSRPGLLSDVGRPFPPGASVALETQHLPDSPNQPHFASTELRPGQEFRSTTSWTFGVDPQVDVD
ncbi:aldose epimerase family protein [Brevundimonas sp. VNH65]|uniref:aldose epimerase family protein n=1 Tax=Brevundimonas sp. VNH65 TaxID=3400917 RepID=UPI003BFE773C